MWDSNDYNGYIQSKQNNIGQIKQTDVMSFFIKKFCDDPSYKNFLEIGTWNGLGSTKIFVSNLIKRSTNDWVFYSLESNKDKVEDAKSLYKNIQNVSILNEVIWNELPSDFYEIFPEIKTNSTFNYWNKIDMENMKLCKKFLDRTDLPEKFDLILFDGGEFTTYHDYVFLKDYAKIIILDDTNTAKCKKIVDNIKTSNEWRIIDDVPNDRNGILVAEKIL
jgi:hypothetical protein